MALQSDQPVAEPDGNGRVFAVTGGTGFIGRHLLRSLSHRPELRIRVLSRTGQNDSGQSANLEFVKGDLADRSVLGELLVPGCTLLNLAYGNSCSAQMNLEYAGTLAECCVQSGVATVVHCSTASVYGRVPTSLVDETTPCDPGSEYGRTKLEIEQVYQSRADGAYRLYVLRPTQVFGEGGLALAKMIEEIRSDSGFWRYARESLYGARRLNLLGVATLVDAMIFLADRNGAEPGVYLVSQDNWKENAYSHVADVVYAELGKRRLLPRVPFPPALLQALLRLRARVATDTRRSYSGEKLARAGFIYAENFAEALGKFVSWRVDGGRK
jgi:nucleoside-diphosphate-sugar epimerase